jgi:hypothetical protein
MRKCLVLFFALALFASPFFFAYLEAERLLGWPDAVYHWFDPWLPFVIIICSSVTTLAFPWIVGWFGESESYHRS